MATAVFLLWNTNVNLEIDTLNLGHLLGVGTLLLMLAGIRIVSREEIAGVMVLGIPTVIVSGGVVIVIPGLFQLVSVSARTRDLRWPENPTKLYYGHEDRVPDGYEMPIRIPFAAPPKDPVDGIDPEDPLNRRSTNEVSLFVRVAVKKERFWDFFTRIGTFVEARHQVEGMSISFINQALTTRTLAQALQQIQTVSESLKTHVRELTKGWGVDIPDARIQLINLSYSLNNAIENAAESSSEKKKRITLAEANQVELERAGVGNAKAARANLEQRAAGLKKMAKVLGVPVETVIAAETARAIAEGPNEKLIFPGFEGLTKIVETVGRSFSNRPPQTPGDKS
ncbi:MAG TPA: SPFH domain-containing protein [Candidatus Paceibacterota bacterium]|nr:SPFH domain-containing protein [Candidatus Paceibacterota bacterium]